MDFLSYFLWGQCLRDRALLSILIISSLGISFRYIFKSKSHLWAEFIFLTSMGGGLASLAQQLLWPQGGHLPLVHHLRLLATDAGRLDRELGHPVHQPGGGAVAVERVASQVPGEGSALVEKRVMMIYI